MVGRLYGISEGVTKVGGVQAKGSEGRRLMAGGRQGETVVGDGDGEAKDVRKLSPSSEYLQGPPSVGYDAMACDAMRCDRACDVWR